MKSSAIVWVMLLMTLGALAEKKPTKSTEPLSADAIAIYKTVLREYAGKSDSLNVSTKTYPLDPESQMNGLHNGDCLKGVRLENLSTVAHTYHNLPSEVLSKNMRLVDPEKHAAVVRRNDPENAIGTSRSLNAAVHRAFETGLFSLSEIAFDKDHRHAVVAYRFWCGSLCGRGSTSVFEKVGNIWMKTNRSCGGWVS